MKHELFIDIETAARPTAEIEALLSAVTPPSNYRDPEKIAAYISEKRSQQLADAALDATLGRILVIGLLKNGAPLLLDDDDEAEKLSAFWYHLNNQFLQNGKIVTFCGHRFDLPFAARRSWALGVPLPYWWSIDNGRPPRTHFIDLAEVWACGDRSETISLDRLGKFLGLGGKNGDGAYFAHLWSTDRHAAAIYLRRDLELTAACFQKMIHAH